MKVKKQFDINFDESKLREIFDEYIAHSGGSGVDNLSVKAFSKQADEHISIISRKAIQGSYRFSKYKQRLVSKGATKPPRIISIPTVRDRVALRALNNFLQVRFSQDVNNSLPQVVVNSVKKEASSGKFNGFIKLDVKDFYPSINHKKLISRIRSRVKNPEILSVIDSAIKSPTVASPKSTDENNSVGIPQGLAISNILSSIYLKNIDKNYKALSHIAYFRYVDDILIFCELEKAKEIANELKKRLSALGLKIHDIHGKSEKSRIGKLGDSFSYLGYLFYDDIVSVRTETVERLKESLAAIFTSYKYSRIQDESFLLWRLDIRITGCIFEGKSKGWLFFFSQITDESLLHSLDWYVGLLVRRFNVNIKPKKFVRAFKEITLNPSNTKYVPNFDNYDEKQKLAFLSKYFPRDIRNKRLTTQKIEFNFRKRIKKQVRDLLEDLKNFRS